MLKFYKKSIIQIRELEKHTAEQGREESERAGGRWTGAAAGASFLHGGRQATGLRSPAFPGRFLPSAEDLSDQEKPASEGPVEPHWPFQMPG